MIEVELKIIVKNITRLEEQLLKKGFTEGNSLKESDYYLDDESGSIRNNDQALRIRCSQDLNSGVITSFPFKTEIAKHEKSKTSRSIDT